MTPKQLNGLIAFLFGGLVLPIAIAQELSASKHLPSTDAMPVAKTDKRTVSYGIGVDMGRNFKRLALDIDLEQLAKGLNDAYTGKPLTIPDTELRRSMSAYQNELKAKQQATILQAAETNQKEGEAFLAANAKKNGVITLRSGLQYKILKQANGKLPSDTDTVQCHYRGTLIDGTEFDSSERIGKAVEFKVGSVMPGWQEALRLMPVGSTWQLFIPPQLAYGAQGAGRDIGPNATLIFEVDLLGIQTKSLK